MSSDVNNLLDYIDASPSPWHAVANVKKTLAGSGFVELNESNAWALKTDKKYFVVRDDSSIIAFSSPSKTIIESGIAMVGAHTDSPSLRVKPIGVHQKGKHQRVAVEQYGGLLLHSVVDRDLSLAGRIATKSSNGIQTKLLNFMKPIVRIPSLAIHLNRNVNELGLKLNTHTQAQLILGVVEDEVIKDNSLVEEMAALAEVSVEDVVSWELNVYDAQKPATFGLKNEFYASRQIDNLASVAMTTEAFVTATQRDTNHLNLFCFFDHEEVGSRSKKGAAGSFLSDVLERIFASLEFSTEDKKRTLANSFLISNDMAHGFHPNYANAYDEEHSVFINKGPVIKIHSEQRYTTESVSEAMFQSYCDEVGVTYQKYAQHGDIPCGSTIGPIVSSSLGVRSVDVGNAMWSMHSFRESAGCQDVASMTKVLTQFYAHYK